MQRIPNRSSCSSKRGNNVLSLPAEVLTKAKPYECWRPLVSPFQVLSELSKNWFGRMSSMVVMATISSYVFDFAFIMALSVLSCPLISTYSFHMRAPDEHWSSSCSVCVLAPARAAGLWSGPPTASSGSTEVPEGYSSCWIPRFEFSHCGLRAQPHCGLSRDQ